MCRVCVSISREERSIVARATVESITRDKARMGGTQSTEVPGGGSEGYHVLKVRGGRCKSVRREVLGLVAVIRSLRSIMQRASELVRDHVITERVDTIALTSQIVW